VSEANYVLISGDIEKIEEKKMRGEEEDTGDTEVKKFFSLFFFLFASLRVSSRLT
jgi:hypothetical protein